MLVTRRRVVTAHKNNRAIVASDVELPMETIPGVKGFTICDMWAAADIQLPDDGELREYPWFFPPVGGFRCTHLVLDANTEANHEELQPGEDDGKPSALSEMTDKPGMHRSATVDAGYIVSGSVVCELDDGETMTLHAGDTFIQGGTIHAWSNPFDEPCHIFAVSVGAKHALVEGH
ncbi:cupin domain-containing protein [Sphingobium phenoxybenzoativorans]|uniref:Cupin domain-containing protein n=1 Tax=Sphingobium phenoxybenzoativorans TaxID=1592790 RepID=A0A975KBX4_9SPHN|nr:cupin domain-containing protein [Sphingobium phenoxybenzoativorans]QUT07818.1 cupin domain-containing protein [Sphingobium phenoxybenzoativorans]